ncbi:hypothetical protein [Streptomyces sp. NPDC102476]|uniref:hypothetical protein n=1 Tax=Streptomyces sp. NPDC102476 TaxID=3366181 RepID=UPI0037F7E52F
MTLKDRLYAEYARILTQQEANIVLESLEFPMQRVTTSDTPQTFWALVRQKLEFGVLNDGEERVVRTIHDLYPANPVLREAMAILDSGGSLTADAPAAVPRAPRHEAPPPTPEVPEPPAPDPVATPPEEHPPALCTTLVFIANSHHGEFIQGAWKEDPKSTLLYVSAHDEAAVGQVAVLLSQPLPQARLEALRQSLLAAGAPADLDILQQDCDHRPYLLQLLRAFGPDQQPFDLAGVPSTTTVSDIASAVLARYDTGPLRDRLRRRRRTVVDRLIPDGSFQRLDPSQSLHDSGVLDGDTLNIYPEATAGVSQLRIQAVLRVRREIFRYRDEHPEFSVDRVDDPDFPTEYEIQFRAPGFRPPDNPSRGALPQPQHEHSALILLGPKFPLESPAVVWLSPVFHPNILPEPRGGLPEGLVCLGPLDESYRPTLDFGQLCQMLVDMARYRNYDVRNEGDGGGGWFNHPAALWAGSEKGAAMIAAIGGVPSAEVDHEGNSPQARALRLRKSDVVDDDA